MKIYKLIIHNYLGGTALLHTSPTRSLSSEFSPRDKISDDPSGGTAGNQVELNGKKTKRSFLLQYLPRNY